MGGIRGPEVPGVCLSRHKYLKSSIQNSRAESQAILAGLADMHPLSVRVIESAEVKALSQ